MEHVDMPREAKGLVALYCTGRTSARRSRSKLLSGA